MVAARGRLPQAAQGGAPHADPRDPQSSPPTGRGTALMRSGRHASGKAADRRRTSRCAFRFDGRAYAASRRHAGLGAARQRRALVGRSLKYHRPRGIVTAGPEEPCALVESAQRAAAASLTRLATTLELREGSRSRARIAGRRCALTCWRSTTCCRRFLPAGFYYKTFMCAGVVLGTHLRAAACAAPPGSGALRPVANAPSTGRDRARSLRRAGGGRRRGRPGGGATRWPARRCASCWSTRTLVLGRRPAAR